MATPAPPAPTSPPNGVPLTPPLAAPQSTVHNREDALYNRLATALTNAANAQPATPVPEPPIVPQPDSTSVPLEPSLPTAPAIEAPQEPPGAVNPEDVDFEAAPDAPAEITDGQPKPALIPDVQLAKTLEEMLAGNEVPEKIVEMHLKTSQGKRMLSAFKTYRELEKAPEPDGKGGLGRLPTIEEIKDGDAARRQMLAMNHEYIENPESFINNLFVVDPTTGITNLGADPAHAVRLLQTIPRALTQAMQQSNSPVYAELMAAYSAPVFTGFLNTQYREALAMPTEPQYVEGQSPMMEAKARRLDALQLVEATVFGKARPINLGAPQQGTQQPDPQVSELQRQLQHERGLRLQNETSQVQRIKTSLESSAKDSALADVQKYLDQTGVTKIHSSEILGPHKNEMYSDVVAALPSFDPAGWQNYEILLDRVARGGGDVAAQAAAKQFSQMFRNAMRQLPAINERRIKLISGAKSASDAQHAARAQSALRTEPNGSGVAVQQPVLSAAQLDRQPGESKEDWYTRRFATSMSNGANRAPVNGRRV